MKYEVKACNSAGELQLLTVLADSEGGALAQAEMQGVRVLSLHANRSISLFKWDDRFDITLFCEELLALLQAGLNLAESIEALTDKAEGSRSAQTLTDILRLLSEGRTFSGALQSASTPFPQMLIATLKSSEQTGSVAEALGRYLSYRKQIGALREKLISASVYPLLLLGFGGLVILFLLGYVVPSFSRVYEDLGQNLPLLSKWMMSWGKFVQMHGVMLGAAFLCLLVAAVIGVRHPTFKARLGDALLRLPVVGDKIRLYQLAAFTHTTAMLVRGGLPVLKALQALPDLLDLNVQRRALENASKELAEGAPFSRSLQAHGLVTEVGARLLIAGEKAGDLAKALERTGQLYDQELTRWIDRSTRLFEPILMIFIGLVIGAIVLLMYMPIFELANAIQ